jgi:hypothetical protein
MNRYLRNVSSAETAALHLLDEATALGDDQGFLCPLPIPREIRQNLVVLHLEYVSFEEELHIGQLVVHRKIAHKVEKGFKYLVRSRFLIASMVPIAAYGWDDMRSMRANNTSGFNYRYKTGSTTDLSLHAYGLAFDINPLWNPCRSRGIWIPPGARYDSSVPGTITKNSVVAQVWRDLGFVCGVDWQEPLDPQHFQFPLIVE